MCGGHVCHTLSQCPLIKMSCPVIEEVAADRSIGFPYHIRKLFASIIYFNNNNSSRGAPARSQADAPVVTTDIEAITKAPTLTADNSVTSFTSIIAIAGGSGTSNECIDFEAAVIEVDGIAKKARKCQTHCSCFCFCCSCIFPRVVRIICAPWARFRKFSSVPLVRFRKLTSMTPVEQNVINNAIAEPVQEPLPSNDESVFNLVEIRSWGKSFDALMTSAVGRLVFLEFLKLEFSEENILFWIACEELKSETDPENIDRIAREIYESYVSIISPSEVSLDAHLRRDVNRNMVEPNVHTFDEAQMHIYMLMMRDSYPRFINSQLYKDLVQEDDEDLEVASGSGVSKRP